MTENKRTMNYWEENEEQKEVKKDFLTEINALTEELLKKTIFGECEKHRHRVYRRYKISMSCATTNFTNEVYESVMKELICLHMKGRRKPNYKRIIRKEIKKKLLSNMK